MKEMIVCNNVSKSFGQLQVLKGLDFSASEGEVVGIVGASGAGKSTFLQIMGTLMKPDSGSIIIDGTDVCTLKGDTLSDFRNRKIGFVFQFHHLLPEFTALENVMMPALIAKSGKSRGSIWYKKDDRQIKEQAMHLLSELGLGERADELHNLFFSLREKYGQTIIIVTHDNELAQRCDRVVEMKDGRFL